MARKQLGMIDDGLLAGVDAKALALGCTRRDFVEMALRAALADDARVATEPRPGAIPRVVAITTMATTSSAAKHDVKPIPKGSRA